MTNEGMKRRDSIKEMVSFTVKVAATAATLTGAGGAGFEVYKWWKDNNGPAETAHDLNVQELIKQTAGILPTKQLITSTPQSTQLSQPDRQPTSQPTELPQYKNLACRLEGKEFNFATEKPTVMFLVDQNGMIVSSTVAKPIPFTSKENGQRFDDFNSHTVLSLFNPENGTTIYAHSGRNAGKSLYFDQMERHLRIDSSGAPRNGQQVLKFMESTIRGGSLLIVQEQSPGQFPADGYKPDQLKDVLNEFKGNILVNTVTGVARIPEVAVPVYDARANASRSGLWLKDQTTAFNTQNYDSSHPWSTGFDSFDPTGLLLKFCLGGASDQSNKNISANRAALWIKPITVI